MMNEKCRLWLFTLFDIFAFGLIYFIVYRQTISVKEAMDAHAQFVEFDTRMYLGLVGIGVPLYHSLWLFDTWRPKRFSRAVYTIVFFGAMTLVLLFAGFMTIQIKHDVRKHGYFYCSEASQQMTISHFAVYVRDMETCDKKGKEAHDRWPKP